MRVHAMQNCFNVKKKELFQQKRAFQECVLVLLRFCLDSWISSHIFSNSGSRSAQIMAWAVSLSSQARFRSSRS